jgi:hypothetical protein
LRKPVCLIDDSVFSKARLWWRRHEKKMMFAGVQRWCGLNWVMV